MPLTRPRTRCACTAVSLVAFTLFLMGGFMRCPGALNILTEHSTSCASVGLSSLNRVIQKLTFITNFYKMISKRKMQRGGQMMKLTDDELIDDELTDYENKLINTQAAFISDQCTNDFKKGNLELIDTDTMSEITYDFISKPSDNLKSNDFFTKYYTTATLNLPFPLTKTEVKVLNEIMKYKHIQLLDRLKSIKEKFTCNMILISALLIKNEINKAYEKLYYPISKKHVDSLITFDFRKCIRDIYYFECNITPTSDKVIRQKLLDQRQNNITELKRYLFANYDDILQQIKEQDDIDKDIINKTSEKGGGKKTNKLKYKKTTNKMMIAGKLRVIYEGVRGGRYVKKNGEFVNIKKLTKT